MPRLHPSKSQAQFHSSRSTDRWVVLGVCALLIAVIWFVFGQTLGHEFVNYDDNKYVFENAVVRGGLTVQGIVWAFTHAHASNWHPLTFISHMLDCQLFGLKPAGHHFTNVLLHAAAAVLLFLVLRQMTGGPSRTGSIWRSAFVAALFAIHPLHVESVAWIAERKDVLSAVFFMLTLGAYTRYARQPSLRRYVTMSILFALGLMSKPMLVTLPFVLLLLDYWPLQRIADLRTLPRLVLEKVPLLVLAAASSIATSLAQSTKLSTIQDLPISSRIGNALVSVCIYIGQMFWPANLAAFYPHPVDRLSTPMSIFSFIFIVVITIVALIVGRKHGYVPVGWFWYLGMLAPVLGLVQVGLQGRADRYTYLPHIGLYLLITWGIVDFSARWPYRRQILGAAAVVLVGVFMWRSQMQAKVWHDTETFWQHALAVTSRNHLAHAALGEIALSRHRLDEAILHLQTAVEIYPDNGQAYNSLGLALLQAGRSDAAVANWKIALEIEPHDLNTQSNLAWVFATSPEPSMRDGPRAVQLMEDVIQRSDRRNPIVLRTLAAAYAESGRFSEAIGTAQEALNLANAGGNSALARALQENIDDYKNKIPLRDPLLIKPPATR